jgi:hypothetical protein
VNRHDLVWRGIGLGAFAAATALGISIQLGNETMLGLPAFFLALIGIVLIVQGRRVPAAWRIERSAHRALAQAIHDRRRQQSSLP